MYETIQIIFFIWFDYMDALSLLLYSGLNGIIEKPYRSYCLEHGTRWNWIIEIDKTNHNDLII